MTTIRLLEELALNALPALETLYYDGWILRFAGGAGGYPRRANSIQMIYPPTLPLDRKIDHCQRIYTALGQKTVFKLTPVSPDGLEAALRARGFALDCPTSVQTLDLAGVDPLPETDAELIAEPSMSDGWYADYARLHDENPARSAVMQVILKQVAVESVFVRLRRGGETVALARGSLDQGWVAPYEVVTDPRYRQQGYGKALMLALLRWGKDCGAHHAYLQVVVENAPANRLYRSLDFSEQYRYWYLQKEP